MKPSTGIVIAGVVIAGGILAHLGYTIHRDRILEEQRAKAETQAVAAQRRTQEKAAWDASLKFLDSDLDAWLPEAAHVDLQARIVSIKEYTFDDVKWVNDRNVDVNGLIEDSSYVSKGRGTTRKDAWFSWRKRMYRRDDGEWDNPGPFVEFRTAGLTKEQEQAAGLLKRVIRKRLDILEGH